MLAGVVHPDEGEIRVGGSAERIRETHHASQLGLAFVFQELTDVPSLSVAENIELGLGYPRRSRIGFLIDWDSLRKRALCSMEGLGIDIDPSICVGDLPAAQRKMVMIARALSRRAKPVSA